MRWRLLDGQRSPYFPFLLVTTGLEVVKAAYIVVEAPAKLNITGSLRF
jgi:hypothetical protein